MGELYSMPHQLEFLAQLRPLDRRARIYSGLRVSRGRGAPQLFSDNIVAVQTDTELIVLGVIEVKSGLNGGVEAHLQAFRWIEALIEDGDQVMLLTTGRRPTTTIGADGTRRLVASPAAYTYKPRSRREPRVVYLQSAPRILITARGESGLGIDPDLIPGTLTTQEFEPSSRELDYLIAVLLQSDEF
jgi:hypothetical protein